MHPRKGRKARATPITKVQEKLPTRRYAFLHRAAPRAQPLGRADWNGWDAVAVLLAATRPAWDIQQHETSANRAMGSRRRNVRY